MNQGEFSLYCIAQKQNRNHFIAISSTPCKFKGKIYCFALNNSFLQKSDEIKIAMGIDGVIADTLKINPKVNVLATNNLLLITRADLPEKLPDNQVRLQITNKALDSYLSGCIWKNSQDDYLKIAQAGNASFKNIHLDKIEPEFKAWFFAVSK